MPLRMFGFVAKADAMMSAAVKKAQDTADNARQMVLNRDPTLKELSAAATTLPEALRVAALEHEQIIADRAAGDKALSDRIDALSKLPVPTSTYQIEYRDGIPVPAILSLLGSSSADVNIVWPTPFPDDTYAVTPQIATSTATLLGKTSLALKSKTKTGCVITVTTAALLSAGSATVSAVAYRKN